MYAAITWQDLPEVEDFPDIATNPNTWNDVVKAINSLTWNDNIIINTAVTNTQI
jgi:hypothetical protein